MRGFVWSANPSALDEQLLRADARVKQGDELLVVLDGKRMILTRPEEHARASRGALKGAWGKSRRDVDRYLARERRSWR